MQTRFEQIQLLAEFLNQAKPLISKERDGVELAGQLLAIEAQLRKTISKDNFSQLAVLDRVRLDLLRIKVQFMQRIDLPITPRILRASSWVAMSIGGLLGGLFIALLICISLQYWPTFKVRLNSAKSTGLGG